MDLVIKSLNRTEMSRIISKTIKTIEANKSDFNGFVSLLTFNEISSPLIVTNPSGKICIADKNYKWLQFAPKNANWWLTVMYNEKNNLIESYFDITKENVFCDNPYFVDMKLDVIIPKDEAPIIVDQDEIKDALTQNLITEKEYKKAFKVANKIIDYYIKNKDLYYKILDNYFKLLI